MHLINKYFKREIKKIIQFSIASKRIKYLGINLTKERNMNDRKPVM